MRYQQRATALVSGVEPCRRHGHHNYRSIHGSSSIEVYMSHWLVRISSVLPLLLVLHQFYSSIVGVASQEHSTNH